MKFTAYDLLKATNRDPKSGVRYRALNKALDRLTGTYIKTNIKNGKTLITKGFHLLDGYEIVREDEKGQMIEIAVKLPEWILNAIQSKYILTYNPKYFTLRRPIDRRLYEIMKKHCAQKPKGWSIRLGAVSQLNFKKCPILMT